MWLACIRLSIVPSESIVPFHHNVSHSLPCTINQSGWLIEKPRSKQSEWMTDVFGWTTTAEVLGLQRGTRGRSSHRSGLHHTNLAVVETKSQKMEVHVCPDTAFNQSSLGLMYKLELLTHAGVCRPSWLTLGKVNSCTVFFKMSLSHPCVSCLAL